MAIINPDPLSKQIQEELKNQIITGGLAPGQRISIEELAQRWHVSTTPVRDALRKLESLGFVNVAPRRAVFVSTLDSKSFSDTFALRGALECLAIELAIPNLPQERIEEAIRQSRQAYETFLKTGDRSLLHDVDHLVHDLVIEFCDNKQLVAFMESLKDQINWARNLIVREPSSYDAAYPEHMRILEALKNRDAKLAQELMREHLRNSCARTSAGWAGGAGTSRALE